ncbi:hypothetical protein IV203_038463 [Nitzschia inconspicua]|uniref:Uncharacterized protein n=1 Tax=Nitzschia inconspicua TaxID=303405 RepID=A0A9K3PZU5_9STRA|nr:hypothetical protein IV203_038463 [Nitzschia inconspicua]
MPGSQCFVCSISLLEYKGLVTLVGQPICTVLVVLLSEVRMALVCVSMVFGEQLPSRMLHILDVPRMRGVLGVFLHLPLISSETQGGGTNGTNVGVIQWNRKKESLVRPGELEPIGAPCEVCAIQNRFNSCGADTEGNTSAMVTAAGRGMCQRQLLCPQWRNQGLASCTLRSYGRSRPLLTVSMHQEKSLSLEELRSQLLAGGGLLSYVPGDFVPELAADDKCGAFMTETLGMLWMPLALLAKF